MSKTIAVPSMLLLGALSSCSSSEDSCGPGPAAATGIKLTGVAAANVDFGPLKAGANNDCPDPMAPARVISLTIDGTQSGGPAPITFCVPRPDLLGKSTLTIGDFKIIDVEADVDGCRLSLLRTLPPTGTASATGLCGNGIDAAGFALTLDAQISLTKKCPNMPDQILRVALGGTASVAGK